jgi:hypothetical protein
MRRREFLAAAAVAVAPSGLEAGARRNRTPPLPLLQVRLRPGVFLEGAVYLKVEG